MITVVNKYKHTPTENDIYIGRGSPLGNIFTSQDVTKTKAEFQADSREDSIQKFEEYLQAKIAQKDVVICDELNRIYKLAKSGEVNLVCFCKPKSCHGDVIKRVIDEKM